MTKINICVKRKHDINSWGTQRTSLHDNVMEISQLNSSKQPSYQGSERQSGFTEAEMCSICVRPSWHGYKTIGQEREGGGVGICEVCWGRKGRTDVETESFQTKSRQRKLICSTICPNTAFETVSSLTCGVIVSYLQSDHLKGIQLVS